MAVWLLTGVMSSKLPDEEINNNNKKKQTVTPMTYISYKGGSQGNAVPSMKFRKILKRFHADESDENHYPKEAVS